MFNLWKLYAVMSPEDGSGASPGNGGSDAGSNAATDDATGTGDAGSGTGSDAGGADAAGAEAAGGEGGKDAEGGEKAKAAAPKVKSLLDAAAEADEAGDGKDDADNGEKDGDADAALLTAEDIAVEVPEGFEYDAEIGDEFKAALVDPELKLGKDEANKVAKKMLDLQRRVVQKQVDEWNKTQAEWIEATNSDPEIGGAKQREALRHANKALDKFGSPGLRKLVDTYGLGNNPDFLRTFANIGKATGDDAIVKNVGGGSRRAADVLYGGKN